MWTVWSRSMAPVMAPVASDRKNGDGRLEIGKSGLSSFKPPPFLVSKFFDLAWLMIIGSPGSSRKLIPTA